jgi:hypothetical protein
MVEYKRPRSGQGGLRGNEESKWISETGVMITAQRDGTEMQHGSD